MGVNIVFIELWLLLLWIRLRIYGLLDLCDMELPVFEAIASKTAYFHKPPISFSLEATEAFLPSNIPFDYKFLRNPASFRMYMVLALVR